MAGNTTQRIWKRAPRPAAPAVPDPADMGTAFGMEVALGRTAQGSEPAARLSWWKRLTSRRAG
jgi:hypothetical protein